MQSFYWAVMELEILLRYHLFARYENITLISRRGCLSSDDCVTVCHMLILGLMWSLIISWRLEYKVFCSRLFSRKSFGTNNSERLAVYNCFKVSTTTSFFESELPCFWIGISLVWPKPSMFRFRPSCFLSHPFSLFKSVLPSFLSQSFPFFRVKPTYFI